ncbi:nucleotide-diphospho-sugar transferase [Massarina eburnea CBS 473.64]|uniref:glycogenin glucosyltransferase n=1 Tax=Massarina eburnea CBS 473.64 TaxID=1395130 RepID=A0A6A6RKN8_9PLEO|nr:nucleotide-diphospho-sugar transferase [Massarina eburnea CBS 473.64]
MATPLEDVYATLLITDSYLPGATVLAHSLRDGGTTKKLAALITVDTLSADTITRLRSLYDYIIPVDRIRNPNPANLFLMGRPDLLDAFTKIALWKQTQFRKIVYLDADVVTLRNLDELFDIEASFAAAPDVGWPDAFNTGVMVLSPNEDTYAELYTMAAAGESFDGADQGLLNQYYEERDWKRLKFTYNCTPNAQYQWEPAYRYHKNAISVVHFIGKDKPWKVGRKGPGGLGLYNELLGHWWAVHDRHSNGESESVRFSGPLAGLSGWDATKSAPPTGAGPEAANFPTQQYGFSANNRLFNAPQSHSSGGEKHKPIFPWEGREDLPKPTRVFAEDQQSDAEPASTHTIPTASYEDAETYQESNPNAWDTVPGIDTYVRAVLESRTQRGNSQVLHAQPGSDDISSPTMKGRHESLILTDFPSAVERPSLPVTPAPVQPNFWGEEKNQQSELPQAEGVPPQDQWVC